MTREEARASIKQHLDLMYPFNTPKDVLKVAYEALEQLKWIPVSERLPKKPKPNLRRGWYLVALESGCVMSLGFEYDGRKWFNTASPVTHWMPLPEPPKEGDEGGG